MKFLANQLWPTLAIGTIFIGAFSTLAAEVPSEFSKPAWLTDCSLNLKESYDNNVFLSGVNNPPPYTVPAGSVAALKNAASWITTVSPKIGLNFAPLWGTTNGQSQLTLTYAPDFVLYHDQNSESYNAHRVLTTAKAGNDFATVNAENQFTYVDGNDSGPFYPGNFYSGFGTIFDRARRQQVLETGSFSLQLNYGKMFFRPAAAWIYNDMMTRLDTTAGYQNYADRADVNGDADLGYKLTDDFAATLGYRYGQQYQQQYSFSPYSSDNRYQRVLMGFEGKPWSWLTLKFTGGPDFRSYAQTAPVNHANLTKYYGEGLATATFSERDAVTFKYKYWQWLAGTGKMPYTDAAYELNYHRKLTDACGLDIGGKMLSWDFDDVRATVCHRCDQQYSATVGFTYTLSSHVTVNASWTLDFGRNAEDNLANAQTREFDRQLVSIGTQIKF